MTRRFTALSKKPAPKSTGATKARVLSTGPFGEIDTVVLLEGDALTAAVESGQVDTDPAAVAYAESK